MTATDSIAGRYKFEECIGRGGQGEVWRAFDRRLHRRVAIKKLYASGDADALLAEARRGSRVTHPNVAVLHDVRLSGRQVLLIMQFYENGTLHDQLDGDPIDEADVIRWGAGIAAGLAALHGKGLIHRDIKLRNVLVDADGTPKISDFGLSRHDRSFSDNPDVAGTPGYLAPELRRHATPTSAADVFALGVCLYIAATADHPFPNEDPWKQMRAAARGLPDDRLPPGALGELIGRMLAPSPSDRPTAKQVQADLEELARSSDEDDPAPTEPSDNSGPARTADLVDFSDSLSSRRPASSGAAVGWVLVVIALVGGGLLWFRPWEPDIPPPVSSAPATAAPATVTAAPSAVQPVTSVPATAPPPAGAALGDRISNRWNEHWANTVYQPFWFFTFLFDSSTIAAAFPFGLLWFAIRLAAAIAFLVVDVPLTVTVFLGGVAYALMGGTARAVVYGLAALLLLVVVVVGSSE